MSASNGQTFVNGKIFTGRSEDEFVSAFRIANGKIAWIGNSSDVDEVTKARPGSMMSSGADLPKLSFTAAEMVSK